MSNIIKLDDDLEVPNLLEVDDILIERNILTTNGISIDVEGDGNTYRGFSKYPYFKLSNNKDMLKATKRTRIAIFDNIYIIHNKEIWTLTNQEKISLVKLLNSKLHGTMTIWDKIKYEASLFSINNDPSASKENIDKIDNAIMPNYLDLHYIIKGKRYDNYKL